MEIDVSTQKRNVAVTVVQPHGSLDAATYQELITRVRKLIAEGARDFVLDLSDVPFISSAGLQAIHSLALMLRGEKLPDSEGGRAALKSVDSSRAAGIQEHIKLVGLREGVAETFEKAGFMQFFATFSDLQKALATF